MIEIFPSSRFKRSFKKMPVGIKKDFNEKIEIFKSHPFLVGQGIKLSGGKANPGALQTFLKKILKS